MRNRFIQLILCIILTANGLKAQTYQPDWKSLDSRPIPGWFQEAKFGIFIHWGVYSVPAWRMLESERYASYAEWYYARVMENDENGGREFHEKNYGKDFDYHAFGPLFRAELWDPEFWAKTFKKAGARYVVLTSKHHDGYCLWPTDVEYKKNWNSMDVGPHRDIVGELSRAVRAEGLRMGLYYSVPDWESVPRGDEYQVNMKYVKKYGVDLDTYVNEICNPQLRELVNKYEPSLIFSDAGEWQFDDEFWGTREFLAWLYNESPVKDEVVVNDRFCIGMPGIHGDYFSSEYADAEIKDHPWEESRGIGGSYGYNRAENLDDYRTSEELIEELISIVSRGGNLLLNVGPAADGRIPVIQQQRLRDIGEWLKVNGEAIYGTTRPDDVGLFPKPYIADRKADDVYFTAKKNNLYVICATYPVNKLVIEGLPSHEVNNITMLGYEKEINWSCDGEMCIVRTPCIYPSELPCQHAWVFKIESQVEHGNSDTIDIPLGVCTGISDNEILFNADYSYIEESVRRFLVPDLGDDVFRGNLAKLDSSKLKVIACNSFLPGSLKSVGPEADHKAIIDYSRVAFARAKKAGVKIIVFGSGDSRQIPEGFPYEEAKAQFINLGKELGRIAAENGITIVLEPLNSKECNFVNSVEEGGEIVMEIDHPNFLLLADFYHMKMDNENPENIIRYGKLIKHVHIAEKEGRAAPGTHGEDFAAFFNALRKINYRGRISIESGWEDMKSQAGIAYKELIKQLNQTKEKL